MPSYRIQYVASWTVAIVAAFVGVVAAVSDPSELGLSPVLFRWIVVCNAFLTIVAGLLPSIRRPPVANDNAGPRSNPDPMPRDE